MNEMIMMNIMKQKFHAVYQEHITKKGINTPHQDYPSRTTDTKEGSPKSEKL